MKAWHTDGIGFSLVAFCHCQCLFYIMCTVVTIFNSVSFAIPTLWFVL